MKKPYIGVTDFKSLDQINQALTCIPPEANRRLHVGLMCSWKTINDVPTATGWENIWPTPEEIHSMFLRRHEVYNVIHYADYDDRSNLVDLMRAVDRCGHNAVDAIQLDMKWPDPKLLSGLKAVYPHVEIIQQIGHTAISESPDWERDLAMYEGLADYVLLDCGMGRGTPFNPQHMVEMVETALKHFGEDQIAVAGGLGPDTYMNLAPILKAYPNISCDAQGQLRTSLKATDPIEMDRVCAYISGVCSLIE
jgi:hypothetical protein